MTARPAQDSAAQVAREIVGWCEWEGCSTALRCSEAGRVGAIACGPCRYLPLIAAALRDAERRGIERAATVATSWGDKNPTYSDKADEIADEIRALGKEGTSNA